MNVNSLKLPRYFYSLDGVFPDGTQRWVDEFAGESEFLHQVNEINSSYQKRRYERNVAYSKWMAAFCWRSPEGQIVPLFKPKKMKWQAIRVLAFKHSESSSKDWWENYQECVFRVFIEPETIYDTKTGEHKQWYLLSPEDCFMVNRHEIELLSPGLKPRDKRGIEKFLPSGKKMRSASFIPVEC